MGHYLSVSVLGFKLNMLVKGFPVTVAPYQDGGKVADSIFWHKTSNNKGLPVE